MRSLAIIALFAVLNCATLWSSDELVLHSGKIIVGEIITADDADPVRIKVQEGSIKATIAYPADQVKSIARGVNQRQDQIDMIRQALHKMPHIPMVSTSVWWDTIESLKDLEADAEYRFAARQFVEYFPDHAAARKALGEELYEGKWMTEAEVKQAQGFVYYDKAWRTEDEVAQIEEAKEKARQERIKQKEIRKARRELEAEARQIARASTSYNYYPSYPLNPYPGWGGGYYRHYYGYPRYRPYGYSKYHSHYHHPSSSATITGGGSHFNFELEFSW